MIPRCVQNLEIGGPILSRCEGEEDADPMTGQVARVARVYSENRIELSFPYQGGTYAGLMLRKHPRHGQLVTIRINAGQLICGTFSGCAGSLR